MNTAGDFEKRSLSGICEHFRSARNAAWRTETPFVDGLLTTCKKGGDGWTAAI